MTSKAVFVDVIHNPYCFIEAPEESYKKELEENESKFGRGPKAPKKYLIVAPMSPETGEITSTMKFRVRNILGKYEDQLTELRKSDEKFMEYIR